MKLLTLNTHSLIEPAYEAKRDAFVEFIRKEQPDVFALQEVNQTAAAPLLADVPAGLHILFLFPVQCFIICLQYVHISFTFIFYTIFIRKR